MTRPTFHNMTPPALLAWWNESVGTTREAVTADECEAAGVALECLDEEEIDLLESGRLVGDRESRSGTRRIDLYEWRVTIGPGLDEDLMAEYMEGTSIEAVYPRDPWDQCVFTGERDELATFRAKVAGIV